MTVSRKIALSLLISVLFFTAFAILSFSGLFTVIEAKFYNPSVVFSLTRELSRDAESLDRFFARQKTRLSDALTADPVRRAVLPNQLPGDVFERTRIFGILRETQGGFQWGRLINAEGTQLYYSTHPGDVLYNDNLSVTYRNYPDIPGVLPYEEIASRDGEAGKFILDQERDRILVSFPFYDDTDVFRGTALFSLSARALGEYLINEGRIKVGEDASVISNPPGILVGRPASAGKSLFPQIASHWSQGVLTPAAIESADFSNPLILVSAKTGDGFFTGRLISESTFSFPRILQILLLTAFFLTVFLTAFLLLNSRQDPVTIIQSRLKELQLSLAEHYYEHTGKAFWDHWNRELEQHREQIHVELKRGINTRGKKNNDIDALVDKFLDVLSTTIGNRGETVINEERLKAVFTQVLAESSAVLPARALPLGGPKTAGPEDDFIEILEELEAVDEPEIASPEEAALAEELEELEEAEPVEEIEELEELQEIDDEAPRPSPRVDLEEIARQIEFAESPETEDEDDEDFILEGDLEIVSPFRTIFSGEKERDAEKADDPAGNPDTEIAGEAEEGENTSPEILEEAFLDSPTGLSVIHRPFLTVTQTGSLPTLQSLPGKEDDILILEEISDEEDTEKVIEERNGIPYIRKTTFDTGFQDLNKDFKNLVDSVIRRPGRL